MNVDPVGDWVLVNKSFEDHTRGDDGEVLVYLTDNSRHFTNWVEIIDVGPKCRHITKSMCNVGNFLQAPDLSNDMKFWKKDGDTGSELFFIRERAIVAEDSKMGFLIEG